MLEIGKKGEEERSKELSFAGAATRKKIVATKPIVVTKVGLLRQNFCYDKHIFVATKV